ncbi:uncharacterized protein [Eleutherodactylus coqui]|uniref:uncharacterized protein n=1 Tax=Eleutherodactylus coqui TaxID=57060 RepID=UPI00346262A1
MWLRLMGTRSVRTGWLKGTRRMPCAVPMICREPTDHTRDCYFCLTKIVGIASKTRKLVQYPNFPSARRPVCHSEEWPVPVPPENVIVSEDEYSDEHAEDREGDMYTDPTFQDLWESNEPHFLIQGDLNDLIRDLNLSKQQAELLGLRLKGWNLLFRDTKMSKVPQEIRKEIFLDFYKKMDGSKSLTDFCKQVDGSNLLTDFCKQLDELKLLTDPFTGTKRFKHVGQSNVRMRNFQEDDLIRLIEQPILTFESNTDPKVPITTNFLIDTYRNLDDVKNELLVAISSRNGHLKHILCVENNSIILKEGELPDEILSETNEFIFYQRYSGVPTDPKVFDDLTKDVIFESSAKRGFFLACSDDGRNLILKRPTEADKTTSFFMALAFDNSIMGFKPYDLEGKMPCHIRNAHDYLLVVHPEESVATFELDGDAKGEEAMFYMNIYKELAFNDGLPVIFSCEIDNKNYLLCVEKNSVIIKKGELPREIPSKTSELIFYAKEFSAGYGAYRLESSLRFGPSLEQIFCLAWNKEKKLILKLYREGSINEAVSFFIYFKENEARVTSVM